VFWPAEVVQLDATASIADEALTLVLKLVDRDTQQPVGDRWLAPPTPLDQGGRSRAMFGRQRVRLRSFPPLGDPLLEVREFVLDGQTTPATSFCGNVLGYARVFGERVSDRCGSRSRRIARPRSSLERA
jgi:hypothetical protein